MDPCARVIVGFHGCEERFVKELLLGKGDLFREMVCNGFINAEGEVTRLIGGSAEPEPDYQNWTPSEADKPGAKEKGPAETGG